MSGSRFVDRRSLISELVLLPDNRSPKPSRRLRHAMYYATFGPSRPTESYRVREPVLASPETRRERRARERHFKLATVALAKRVREADAESVVQEEAAKSVVLDTLPARTEVPTLRSSIRKMTGAVRRGLARGKKA